MSFKLLAHNWIAHPLAGLLWYLGDKLASPSLETLGERVHELIFSPADRGMLHWAERWQAEFNLVFYSGGMWTASEVADMSDEQLASMLEALHVAKRFELDARKKAGPPAPQAVRIVPEPVYVELDGRKLSKAIADGVKTASKSINKAATRVDFQTWQSGKLDRMESRAKFHGWSNPEPAFIEPLDPNGPLMASTFEVSSSWIGRKVIAHGPSGREYGPHTLLSLDDREVTLGDDVEEPDMIVDEDGWIFELVIGEQDGNGK